MEQKIDFRIQKTHMALSKAFHELLQEKRFEDITVSELCERAMVRRATFYKHFADKNEFFEFFIRQVQEDMNQGLPKADDTDDFKRFYARMVCHVLNYMEDNEKMVKLILKSSMQLTLVEILSEQLIQDCITKLKMDRKKGIQYPASPNTMASFYVGALMFTIRFWYLSDKRMTKEETQKEIQAIVDSINHDCTVAE